MQRVEEIAAIQRPLALDKPQDEKELLAHHLLWNDPNDTGNISFIVRVG